MSADDFGISEDINHSIIQTYQSGLVSSTSLMSCGEAFEEAARLALSNPGLDLGLHLTLDEERPLSQPSLIPSLVNSQGLFFNRSQLLRRLVLRQINPKDLRAELRAQFQKCLERGLTLSHFDGHGYVHVFPQVAEIAAEVAKDYGVTKTRMPKTKTAFSSLTRFARSSLLNTLAHQAQRHFHRTGLQSPDHFAGFHESGRLDSQAFHSILEHLPSGQVTEIVSHPGKSTQTQMTKYGHWKYNWEWDLSSLLSENKETFMRTRNIAIISFRDL